MTSTRIVVIGGGFVGRLVQFLVPYARVLDCRKAPVGRDVYQTCNFGAHYLWQPLQGLSCALTAVHTTVDGQPPKTDAIRRYKEKVGKVSDIIDWEGQFREHQTGWKVPEIPGSNVEYGREVEAIHLHTRTLTLRDVGVTAYDMLVSTIPLPALVRLCGLRNLDLVNRPIYVSVEAGLASWPKENVLHVDYSSEVEDPVYRRTNRYGIELHQESLISTSRPSCTALYPGKIYGHPVVPPLQRLLRDRHIFCFGRFASWSPDELAHETYANIQAWKRKWAL